MGSRLMLNWYQSRELVIGAGGAATHCSSILFDHGRLLYDENTHNLAQDNMVQSRGRRDVVPKKRIYSFCNGTLIWCLRRVVKSQCNNLGLLGRAK